MEIKTWTGVSPFCKLYSRILLPFCDNTLIGLMSELDLATVILLVMDLAEFHISLSCSLLKRTGKVPVYILLFFTVSSASPVLISRGHFPKIVSLWPVTEVRVFWHLRIWSCTLLGAFKKKFSPIKEVEASVSIRHGKIWKRSILKQHKMRNSPNLSESLHSELCGGLKRGTLLATLTN
jgi:hypothetical protein